MISKTKTIKTPRNCKIQQAAKMLAFDCLCTHLRAMQITMVELLDKEVEVTVMVHVKGDNDAISGD